ERESMTTQSFEYKATRLGDQKTQIGVINALSEQQARLLLRDKKLVVTSIKQIQKVNETKAGGTNWIKRLQEMVMDSGKKNLVVFARNMAIMSRAGIPLTDGLIFFENFVTHEGFKAIVRSLRQDIMTGQSLSSAMAKHPQMFNNLFVNLVRAGEASGDLDATLTRMMEQMERQQKIKSKIISALVYPGVVVGILALVMTLMFTIVIPTFQDIYKSMNVKLPFITQVVVFISEIIRGYWFIVLPVIGAGLFTGINYLKTPAGKFMLHRLSLKIPVWNKLTVLSSNASFFSSFGIAFSAGLPISDAVLLATSTVANDIIRSKFQQVYTQIQLGQSMATALMQTQVVPELVMLMISAGEQSGELEKMLKMSQDLLEEEVNGQVDTMTAMIEPLLMVVLGAVVGAMALSIYLPLFSMYEHM
ncbi:MAG: type II secretion system F family protein, partial [Vampirovibrionales bacterium]|nr:type II secretion system F family protein [Vampirovibrionales bacterium]